MNKGFSKINTLVIVLLLIAAAYFISTNHTQAPKDSIQDEQVNQTPNLNTIFGLNQKESGTQIYYSEKLGVGLTYLPYENSSVQVTEKDNSINIDDQTIEVFDKDSNVTLQKAIEDKFLHGYDPKNCFVKTYDHSAEGVQEGDPTYTMAIISYPPTTDTNAPFWQNSEKCPQQYSATNGLQYFLYNPSVPSKFLFVRIGQYSAASDGLISSENGGFQTQGRFNWSNSIRILK